MKKKKRHEVRNIMMIIIAALIYSIGISCFLDPNKLAPGGITGIAVILNRLLNVETGTLYFWLNVPIVLLGIWKFGIQFMAKTAFAIVMVSVFTNMLNPVGALTTDLLIAGAVGGILIAVGIGLIFKAGATTGGTDIIVKILRQKFRHLKTGFLFLCMDIIIVSISGVVFKDLNIVFYALVTVIISGTALDYVLYGGDEAKMILVMTDMPEEIGNRLMNELEVGITYLQGKGGWKDTEKLVVFTIVPKRLGPQVEEIVKNEDPKAFMVISSANEIYGEGYKDFFAEVI